MEILKKGVIPPTVLEKAEWEARYWSRKKKCRHCGTEVLVTANDVKHLLRTRLQLWFGYDNFDESYVWQCPLCERDGRFWSLFLPRYIQIYAQAYNQINL